MFTEVGQQAARFTLRDDRTLFVFVFSDSDADAGQDADQQRALLRRRFQGHGWECDGALDALDKTDNFYFDRVSQIRMDRWAAGRIGLVGDAAFCVSLLAGQGSALAMAAAYVLAGELKAADGDHARAFARYQQRLAGFIAGKQDAALRFAGFFAPRSRFRLRLRNQVTRLFGIPLLAELLVGRQVTDSLELPAYPR